MTHAAADGWTYAGETGVAFLAGAIVAAATLSTALCGGDEELPPAPAARPGRPFGSHCPPYRCWAA